MTKTTKELKIDEIMARVRDALGRGAWFEAERMAMKALHMARSQNDFIRMASIAPSLCESRLQRAQVAIDTGVVSVLDESISEEMNVEPGCYLIQPQLVGADARRLRLMANTQDVPALILCREPMTQMKLWPIVAISPGMTIRMKVQPPDDEENPDLDWFLDVLEDFGEWAVETLDPKLTGEKRIDALLACIDAVPDHKGLHDALQNACTGLAQEAA